MKDRNILNLFHDFYIQNIHNSGKMASNLCCGNGWYRVKSGVICVVEMDDIG